MNRTVTIILFLTISALTSCRHSDKPQFKLEKVIFHSIGKGCEGFCPTYHIEIDSNQNVKLYSQTVFKQYDEISRLYKAFYRGAIDTAFIQDSIELKEKMGYFIGHALDSNFIKLRTSLQKINLDLLEYKDAGGYDGVNKTLIIFYNGKRKVLKAMFPPDSTKLIYQSLYDIIQQDNFSRTDTFMLDE